MLYDPSISMILSSIFSTFAITTQTDLWIIMLIFLKVIFEHGFGVKVVEWFHDL
jgi:hypothetical protein